MKKLLFIIYCISLLACNQTGEKKRDEINDNIGKIRSFVFVNSDSVKYYRGILRQLCKPEIPFQRALLKYADGLYYLTAGIHSRALNDFSEAAPLFEKEKNDSFLAYCNLGMGNSYKFTGDYDKSVFHYLTAMRLFEKIGNRFFITVCNVNLAETYEEKNDIEKAKHYLQIAKANEPYGSKTYVSILHLEANLYGMSGLTDSAVSIDNTGIQLAEKNNYPDKLSPFYDNLAQCFIELKKYDSAEYYYRKCIYADSLNGRIQLMADTYAQMVSLYGYKKQEEKMTAAAARALALCDSTQYLKGRYAVYEGLDHYYSSAGNRERSAATKDSVLAIYKRLINEETEAKTIQYNLDFETSRKEQLITRQENDLQKANYLLVLFAVTALLLALIIFVLYKNYRTRRMMAVNKAVQHQKDLNVQAVFESEQAERIRIARDLHDSIGQKLSVLKMYLSGSSDETKAPALLDDTIREVRDISHNLLPEELNFGFARAIRTETGKIRDAGTIRITEELENEEDYHRVPLPAALNMLRIFNELLSNIVKHSGATEVFICAMLRENIFILQVRDNGKGIDEEMIAKSTGIGWKNIFARVNMLTGNIVIEKNKPAGSIVTIKIPLH